MKMIVSLLATLALVSCVTVPPSSDQIKEKVSSLLGVPVAPGIPDPTIATDPTQIRWTIFRNQEETVTTNSSGQSQRG